VEASPAVLIDYFGQHKILWANAYPRPDGFFAGAPEMVRKKLKGPVGEYSAAGHGRRRQGILRFAVSLGRSYLVISYALQDERQPNRS
jgi:hypothetical protein